MGVLFNMKYISLGDGKWVEVNEETNASRVIVKSEVEARITEIDTFVGENQLLTDKQLITWAKENYPMSPDYREVEANKLEKAKLEELLTYLE